MLLRCRGALKLSQTMDADAVRELIERYNAAWNAQDLDAIHDLHHPDIVFDNHTAGERAEGDGVREHIATIFANWPDLSFAGRRLYARDGLVVSEWTATASTPDGRRLTWDGVDVFPCEDGRILRKDVYSAAHRARTLDG